MSELREQILATIQSCKVVIFSLTYCHYCNSAKKLLHDKGITYQKIEVDKEINGPEIRRILLEVTQQKTFPNIFIDGQHVGGLTEFQKYLAQSI